MFGEESALATSDWLIRSQPVSFARTTIALFCRTSIPQPSNAIPQLTEVWEFLTNNDFADTVLRETRLFEGITTSSVSVATVCDTCSRIDFCAPLLQIRDRLVDLETKSRSCAICKLRWNSYKQRFPNSENESSITFDKIGSHLRLNNEVLPVLTILRQPGKSHGPHRQVGELSASYPWTDIHLQRHQARI